MTLYCPSCSSTNIVQVQRPKDGALRWYCNNCGARNFTPEYQPDVVPTDPPADGSQVVIDDETP